MKIHGATLNNEPCTLNKFAGYDSMQQQMTNIHPQVVANSMTPYQIVCIQQEAMTPVYKQNNISHVEVHGLDVYLPADAHYNIKYKQQQ